LKFQRALFALAAACPVLLPPIPANAAARPSWPATPLARVEALAILQSLQADLLSHDSATLVLDDWCARHRLAPPGTKIVAEVDRTLDTLPSTEVRALLRVGGGEPVRYRRVRLRCGALVLSEADNWYVPARLTPAMNEQLDTTDIAFGRAVQSLHFHRQTLGSHMLWSPLPADWDSAARIPRTQGRSLAIPAKLIENRAILSLPDGTPFSAVVETYTGAVLAFRPPNFAR
jgi:chorismate-pyruvate lyase